MSLRLLLTTAALAALAAADLYAPSAAFAAPGAVIWETTYSSRPGEDDDHARGLAIDARGDVAVTGYVNGRQGNYNYLTIKYGPYGTTEWVREFDHSWYDVGRAVAFDFEGNVIVAGASNNLENPRDSYSGAFFTDYRVVKYSPAGAPLVEMAAAGNLKNNEPAKVALGKRGSIYVTGTAKNPADVYPVYYTVKFSPAGELLWARSEDWGTEAYATGIRLDPEGNPVVTGYYKDLETGNYYIKTIRYDTEGEKAPAELTYKSETFDVKASDLVVGPDGSIVITGETSADRGVTLTLKYSPVGELLWAVKYSGSEYKNHGNAVAVDDEGRVYVAGRTFKEEQTGDFLLLVYDKDGRLIDGKTYTFGGDSSAEDIALDVYGNIVITGTTTMPGQPGFIRTVRIEGYQVKKESESVVPTVPAGAILNPPGIIRLSSPARPMLRKVELKACLADPKDPDSSVSVVASPVAAPGEYEYRFLACPDSAHHWERLRDYTGHNSIIIKPGPKKPVKVMVEVRAKGSELKYEAREELDLEPAN